jgi:hypothetical protein
MLRHLMEQASLRPVPLRPPGPVDPAEASAHVISALPALDEPAARALALVEIAGRSRDQVAGDIEFTPEALATALTRARKELRRTIFPLSASGWCERAETLISDRIDGVLTPPGPARLEAHLRNCDRCVEHDRRLAQARDTLVRDFIDAHPHAEIEKPAALRVVSPQISAVPEPPPEREPSGPLVPSFGGPAREPVLGDAATELPAPTFAGPGDGWTPAPQPAPAPRPSLTIAPRPLLEVVPDPDVEDPPLEREIAPAEPADATPSETDADPPAQPPVEDAAPSPVAPKRSPADLIWAGLYGVAIVFTVLTVVLLALALAGVDRII